MNWKNVLLGLAVAVFFSLIYLFGLFDRLGDQVYDLFLRFRENRERSNEIVFLDVDDKAIAYSGEFPWPRSITADALLRLKEYGAKAAIFDIEYIDKGPQGVDTIYLNHGLPMDFGRTFSDIDSSVRDIFSAFREGRISRNDLEERSGQFSDFIRMEQNSLFSRAQKIARDNDKYLFEASALFGKSWASLNLREPSQEALTGEQAERRPIAEELFSYPIKASSKAVKGKYIDVLPTLPGFAQAARGAGFTNVEIDADGTRRRIDLAQNIFDHWYLQLSFAPLIDYLGNPEIELNNRKMLLKNAITPDGITKNISIPLDGNGRMILDWPKKDYVESYEHISFEYFSILETTEAELEKYSRALGTAGIEDYDAFDDSLKMIPFLVGDISDLFNAIHDIKDAALEICSDKLFSDYVEYRGMTRDFIRRILEIDPGARMNNLAPGLAEANPGIAGIIMDDAGYITALTENLRISLVHYENMSENVLEKVQDKFCILGRVDTGTTDYGANPFHGKYINVGTHGVVLDMILSEVFITDIAVPWRILFTIIFVFLYFIASAKFSPVPRVVSGFLATAIVITGSAMLFRYAGIFISPLLTVFAMVSAVILREIIAYAGSEREKQFIRKAFSTYVSDDVVKEIIADPSRLQLGGTKRHMSAIFTDVRSFSTISEKLDPEGLVSLLNRYLTFMSDVVLEEKGTIDKYEGDAIIAFFGAPMDLPDHALRACLSAIVMKRIEKELNKTVLEEKLSPLPLLTRVGINTGDMVAGNMGTGNKMNYTIMGNAVNLAARLEGVNKQYGTWIVASDNTIRETGNQLLTRRIDRVRVVGINEPVQLHEILNTINDAVPEEKNLVETFHQALGYYENRKWKEAMSGFKESHSLEREGGGPSVKYFERCKYFLQNPPPDGWDGVHNLTEK
ncbi:MAG: adenylate/guanylate cyclase domain-containing protein [Treponema sp.]|jgi:adenylate cyclase|nr:adenylate/guanylate cyclase domain-containing protein [Treponema sp.]